MAEQQSSPHSETRLPIYQTDCRHDVMAGECAATHRIYISTFLWSSPFPTCFFFFFFHLVSPSSLFLSPFLFFYTATHPYTSIFLSCAHETKHTHHLIVACQQLEACNISALHFYICWQICSCNKLLAKNKGILKPSVKWGWKRNQRQKHRAVQLSTTDRWM